MWETVDDHPNQFSNVPDTHHADQGQANNLGAILLLFLFIQTCIASLHQDEQMQVTIDLWSILNQKTAMDQHVGHYAPVGMNKWMQQLICDLF